MAHRPAPLAVVWIACALALAGWVLIPFLLLWLAQPRHFVAGRHVAFVMPALMLLVAHGVTTVGCVAIGCFPSDPRIPRHLLTRAATAVAAALLLWTASIPEALGGYYQRRHWADWRTVADVLDRLVVPGDQVLATLGASYPLRYYWRPDVLGVDLANVPGPPALGAPGPHVWIVTLAGWDDSPELARWLGAHAITVGEVPASWSLPTVYIHRAR